MEDVPDSKPRMSASELVRIMEAFRLSHHDEIQQIARHTEYEWLDFKAEHVLVVHCPHRLTHRELHLEKYFCTIPIQVQFAPHLSILNPDKHTNIMRRLLIDNEGLVDTQSQFESPGSLLRSFTSTYHAELQCLRGHTTILAAKLRDEKQKDTNHDVVVVITSDWNSAIPVEMALHGKYFEGHEVLVLRDEWDECSSAPPNRAQQNAASNFDNAWQDPPLLPKIMLGAWMGDMSSSVIFDIEITDKGKMRRICPAMLQTRHGFENTDAERENPQILIGKRVLDPGACLVQKTIRYLKDPTRQPQPEKREYILHVLETGALRKLTGSDDGLLADPLRYTNYGSKTLKPLSVGKIRIVMDDSDACFVQMDPSSEIGRDVARPANALAPEGVGSRQFIRDLITEETGVLKQQKLTGTFNDGTEALIAAHETQDVFFLGARSGLKQVRLFECLVYIENVWENKEHLEDKIHLGTNSTWTVNALVGMYAVSRSRSAGGFGNPPAQGGDSSGPVFNRDGVFLGVVKGSWKGAGVSFMVPFSAIHREANRKGMRLRLL